MPHRMSIHRTVAGGCVYRMVSRLGHPVVIGKSRRRAKIKSVLPGSLLGIKKNPVVDQNDQVVFPMTDDISDNGLAWLGEITAPTSERPLLENLPAVGGD